MILNLTQHTATAAQVDAGVADMPQDSDLLRQALTFDAIPDSDELAGRARFVASLALNVFVQWTDDNGPKVAMIGGAPYFMAHLERSLREVGIQPVYAFSQRESVDQPQPDGTIRKVAVFRHLGFVEA